MRRAREGYRVTREDIGALLEGGAPREQLHAAFAGEGEALQHARAVIAATARSA